MCKRKEYTVYEAPGSFELGRFIILFDVLSDGIVTVATGGVENTVRHTMVKTVNRPDPLRLCRAVCHR